MDAMNARISNSLANDGRNEIRVNNSAGRCLLENWVEERANLKRDPPLDKEYNLQERAGFLRCGHEGLITIDGEAKADNLTTVRVSYGPQIPDQTRHIGKRKELMEQAFAKAVCEDMIKEKAQEEKEALEGVMCTTFMKDYTRDFPKRVPDQTLDHDVSSEQPVTFWTEHKDKIHGTTNVKTRDTAFRRNDAFSKPIGEYWDEPKPYEAAQYPMM